MSLILHLSDIHLAPVEYDQVFDDYKSDIVPLQDRQQRHKVLGSTLSALGESLTKQGRKLDAVVVTGDITVANDTRGYQMLPEMLKKLGSAAPARERIVVVPGNHDVTWFTPPSTAERYSNFKKYVTDKGFVTPLLDGVDFPPQGELSINFVNRYLRDPDNNWLIVPINSANYSGSLEPVAPISEEEWDKLAECVSGITAAEARKVLRRVRLHDAARISLRQFDVLKRLMTDADREIEESGGNPGQVVKIALLHHHLLPVSRTEEVKSFESIVNLGLLREFLASHNFNIALHGHKHTGFIYWDHIYDFNKTAATSSHRVLVVSGSTVGGEDYKTGELCRLLEIKPRRYAPTLLVSSVPAVYQGGTLDLSSLTPRHYTLGQQEQTGTPSPQTIVISGATADEVYERTMARFSDVTEFAELYNLVCQVSDSSTAKNLPPGYPNLEGVQADERQKWFNGLVNWWQRRESKLSRIHFTHGNRIYRYEGKDGNPIDQFDRIVRTLKNKDNSQRAVVTLLNPRTDEVNEDMRKFPSFCLVQFIIRTVEQVPYLDCVGYFRKQEFRYWWPVNLAELAVLQSKALERLGYAHKGLRPGTLTTIAAIGYAGTTPPRVAIPAIDLTLDDDPNLLWSMAYALFWKDIPRREALKERWDEFLDDLVPREKFNQDGIPVALDGIAELVKQVNRFIKYHQADNVDTITGKLQNLYDINLIFAKDTAYKPPEPEQYSDWRTKVIKLVGELRTKVDAVFDQTSNGTT